MQRIPFARRAASALIIAIACACASSASAQLPIPTNDTPTLHGGTPIDGMAVGGEIGYAALRGAFYYGRGTWDVAIDAGIPTFGAHDWLHGYNQSLGLDLRAPFRIRLAQWRIATGSFKVGPFLHVGRSDDWNCNRRGRGPFYDYCDGRRAFGTGALLGFVTDIALPKLFKLVVGIEQQFGFLGLYDRGPGNNDYTAFAGATWLDLGLEAFWRDIFFTMIINVGAQYGSNNFHENDHALFRQLFGVGYKFK